MGKGKEGKAIKENMAYLNIITNLRLLVTRISQIKKEQRNKLLNMRLMGSILIIFNLISMMGRFYWLRDNSLSKYPVKLALVILVISIINGALALAKKNLNRLIHILLSSFIVILGIIYFYKTWEVCSALESYKYQTFCEKTLFIVFVIIFNLILIFLKRSGNNILIDVNKGCLLAFAMACFSDLLTNKISSLWDIFYGSLMIIGVIIAIISYFYWFMMILKRGLESRR